jgi:hypothetical protein
MSEYLWRIYQDDWLSRQDEILCRAMVLLGQTGICMTILKPDGSLTICESSEYNTSSPATYNASPTEK